MSVDEEVRIKGEEQQKNKRRNKKKNVKKAYLLVVSWSLGKSSLLSKKRGGRDELF